MTKKDVVVLLQKNNTVMTLALDLVPQKGMVCNYLTNRIAENNQTIVKLISEEEIE